MLKLGEIFENHKGVPPQDSTTALSSCEADRLNSQGSNMNEVKQLQGCFHEVATSEHG